MDQVIDRENIFCFESPRDDAFGSAAGMILGDAVEPILDSVSNVSRRGTRAKAVGKYGVPRLVDCVAKQIPWYLNEDQQREIIARPHFRVQTS